MVSLVLAMILARLLDLPASKLAMAWQLDSATATFSTLSPKSWVL
jgi:hypothetical protein